MLPVGDKSALGRQLVRMSVAAVSSGRLQRTTNPVDTSALGIPVR